MRTRFLASIAGVLVGSSLALGQPPQEATPTEAAPTAAEPADAASQPPHPYLEDLIWNGLTCHFDGTCGHVRGDVFTADVEYLWWALRNANVPVALASTNALGVTGTQILIGQHDLNYYRRPNSGARISLAYWDADPLPELDWDRPRTEGVEANYFFLGQRSIEMRNDTAQTLIRPFFALNNRSETGVVVAASGINSGGVAASANYGLWGGELNCWKNIYYDYPGKTVRLDFLAGFRYLDLGEDLSVSSFSVYVPQPPGVFQQFAGNQLFMNDLFNTHNQFYGGQIGAAVKFFLEVFDLNLVAKIAFGESVQEVHIDGFQVRTLANGATTISPGGLLALSSNIGRVHADQFAVVPEVDITASYAICRHVSVKAGYTFLYYSRVVRPGDQIDRAIDVTRIPNFPNAVATPTCLVRPGITFNESDFWAQGLTVGLQIVW